MKPRVRVRHLDFPTSCLAGARRTFIELLETVCRLVVAVDAETDQWIQETIRTQFDGTILTIAHRLVTLTDYDRIVVLDNGSVAEEGAPVELLRKHDSIFRCMCGQAGDIDQLMKTFEEAAAQKALRDTQTGQG